MTLYSLPHGGTRADFQFLLLGWIYRYDSGLPQLYLLFE